MGWWKRRQETRALNLQQLVGWDEPATFANAASYTSSDDPLRLAAVWACVRLLADTVSTLPVDVFRRGSRDPLPSPPLFANPAAGWNLVEWLYAVMVSLLLRGNAYGLITARTGATMRPAQVELLHPDLVVVRIDADGTVDIRYRGQALDPDDVWHVRAYVFPGSPTGLSPVEYARQAVGLGLATQRFGVQFFEEGAMPTGLLSSDERVSPDQVKIAKETFVRVTRGKREPVVLGGGMKYQPIAVSPEESQFLETQKFTVAQIARIYGVPPEMIAGEAGNSLTYANVEGRALDFLKFTVNPWLVRLETAVAQLLPRGQTIKFNVDALLRSTTKDRYDAHKVALDAGFLTVDEVRQLEDRPPLGGIA